MPDPFTPCGWATPETALLPFSGWPARRAAYGRLLHPWIPHGPTTSLNCIWETLLAFYCTDTGPVSFRNESLSAIQNKVRIMSKQGQNKVGTKSEQGQNKVGTRPEQYQNKVRTKSEQCQNNLRTRSERGQNKVRTRSERCQNKVRTRSEQGQNKVRTNSLPSAFHMY
jgi:hypothetical protein